VLTGAIRTRSFAAGYCRRCWETCLNVCYGTAHRDCNPVCSVAVASVSVTSDNLVWYNCGSLITATVIDSPKESTQHVFPQSHQSPPSKATQCR
jgi:hypothetical protein